jgi:hypothetical protein
LTGASMSGNRQSTQIRTRKRKSSDVRGAKGSRVVSKLPGLICASKNPSSHAPPRPHPRLPRRRGDRRRRGRGSRAGGSVAVGRHPTHARHLRGPSGFGEGVAGGDRGGFSAVVPGGSHHGLGLFHAQGSAGSLGGLPPGTPVREAVRRFGSSGYVVETVPWRSSWPAV